MKLTKEILDQLIMEELRSLNEANTWKDEEEDSKEIITQMLSDGKMTLDDFVEMYDDINSKEDAQNAIGDTKTDDTPADSEKVDSTPIDVPVSNTGADDAEKVIQMVSLNRSQKQTVEKILEQNKQLLAKQALPTFKLSDHWLSNDDTNGKFLFDIARAKLAGGKATEALSGLCTFIGNLQKKAENYAMPSGMTDDQFIANLMFAQTFYTFMKGMQGASGGFMLETFLASFLKGGKKMGGNQELIDVRQMHNEKPILYSLKFYKKSGTTGNGFKVAAIKGSSLAEHYDPEQKIILLVGAKDKANYPDVVEFGVLQTTAGAYASENFKQTTFQWIGNREQSTIDFSKDANLTNFIKNATATMNSYHKGLNRTFEHYHNFKVLISSYYSSWDVAAALGAKNEYESLKASINKGDMKLNEDISSSRLSATRPLNVAATGLSIDPPADDASDDEKQQYKNIIKAYTAALVDGLEDSLVEDTVALVRAETKIRGNRRIAYKLPNDTTFRIAKPDSSREYFKVPIEAVEIKFAIISGRGRNVKEEKIATAKVNLEPNKKYTYTHQRVNKGSNNFKLTFKSKQPIPKIELDDKYKTIYDGVFARLPDTLTGGSFKNKITKNIKQIKLNFADWINKNVNDKVWKDATKSITSDDLTGTGTTKKLLFQPIINAAKKRKTTINFGGTKLQFKKGTSNQGEVISSIQDKIGKDKAVNYLKSEDGRKAINWAEFVEKSRNRLFTKFNNNNISIDGKVALDGKLFDSLYGFNIAVTKIQNKLFKQYVGSIEKETDKTLFYKLGNVLKQVADADDKVPEKGQLGDFYKDVADDEFPKNVLDDKDIVSIATDPSDDNYSDIVNAAFGEKGKDTRLNVVVSKYVNPDADKRPKQGQSWEDIAYNFQSEKGEPDYLTDEVKQVLSNKQNQKAFGAAEGLPVYNVDESFGRTLNNKTMVPLLFKNATDFINTGGGIKGGTSDGDTVSEVPLFTTLARCCAFLNKITDSGESFTLSDMSSVLSKLTLLQSFTSMVQGSDESSVMGFYLESFFSSLIKGGSRGGSNLDLVDVYQLPDDGGKKFFYSLKFYEGNPNQFRTKSIPASSTNLVKAAFGNTKIDDRFKLIDKDLEARKDGRKFLPVHIICGIKDKTKNPTKIAFGYQIINSAADYGKLDKRQFQPITPDPSDCTLDLTNFEVAKRTAYSIMQSLGIDINGIFKGINDFKILYTYYLLNPGAKVAGIAAMESIKAARNLINKSFEAIATADSAQAGLKKLTESVLDHLIMEVITENKQKPKQNENNLDKVLDKLIKEVILNR